jgi:hypothetical protein
MVHPNQYEVLYWKVQVGIKRLNQQVLLMLLVKILPEDADPMDLRFNMINCAPRNERLSFGSAVDPRTGEILKGNVSLGYACAKII